MVLSGWWGMELTRDEWLKIYYKLKQLNISIDELLKVVKEKYGFKEV
jgi:hypothetical protein